MNEHSWSLLVDNSVFLPPAIVERFAREFGNAAVMPVSLRGNPKDWGAPHNNGFPICSDGKWYSLWGMRPSRDACSLALGLKRRDLEVDAQRVVACTNGKLIGGNWRVHHVYECGLSTTSVAQKAAYFTNLANLVPVTKEYHEEQSGFIHGDGPGAQWLRWVISQLYPVATREFMPPASQPVGSPGIALVNVALERHEAYNNLKSSRECRPAGSDIATRRLLAAIGSRAGDPAPPPFVRILKSRGSNDPSATTSSQTPLTPTRKPKHLTSSARDEAPNRWRSPSEVTQELKWRGFLARQNGQIVSLYVNLGGKQSELNRDDFGGIILYYPSDRLMLGVSPEEASEFRQLVMRRIGPNEWERQEGVPGPEGDSRVSVDVVVRKGSEPAMMCEVNGSKIWFDGFLGTIGFQDGLSDWHDVEVFLEQFDRFCRQAVSDA